MDATFGAPISRGSPSTSTRSLNPVELPLPDADYLVAPTTHQPIVRQSREIGERELVLARWA